MTMRDAVKRFNEIESRNSRLLAEGVSIVYASSMRMSGVRDFGYYLARHVRQDELWESEENAGFAILPLIEEKKDVAVFAWFQRAFGDAVSELVDTIDDGDEFLEGVYQAHEEGKLGAGT